MLTKSNNIEIMVGNETDETIEKLFESLLQRSQEGLEESLKGSEFIFNSVNLLHFIDSPEWLKNKKAIINPKLIAFSML